MIKALTIHAPWANLIALQKKRFETRGWDTKYRGKIVIHVGRNRDGLRFLSKELAVQKQGLPMQPAAQAMIDTFEASDRYSTPFTPEQLLPVLGCGIAVADLVGCHRMTYSELHDHSPEVMTERFFGFWSSGRYAWELKNVQLFVQPVPAKGLQRLWNWTLPFELENGEAVRDFQPNKSTIDPYWRNWFTETI